MDSNIAKSMFATPRMITEGKFSDSFMPRNIFVSSEESTIRPEDLL